MVHNNNRIPEGLINIGLLRTANPTSWAAEDFNNFRKLEGMLENRVSAAVLADKVEVAIHAEPPSGTFARVALQGAVARPEQTESLASPHSETSPPELKDEKLFRLWQEEAPLARSRKIVHDRSLKQDQAKLSMVHDLPVVYHLPAVPVDPNKVPNAIQVKRVNPIRKRNKDKRWE